MNVALKFEGSYVEKLKGSWYYPMNQEDAALLPGTLIDLYIKGGEEKLITFEIFRSRRLPQKNLFLLEVIFKFCAASIEEFSSYIQKDWVCGDKIEEWAKTP